MGRIVPVVITSLAVGMMLAIAAPAPEAHASRDWWQWREDHDEHSHRHHRKVYVLPTRSIRIEVNGRPYRYHRGRFYCHDGLGYSIVTAPVGARVAAIPDDHQTVIVDGVVYHYYDGAFYKGGPAGFEVVPVPVPIITAGAGAAASDTSMTETLVINVPNANGSYMPVRLQVAQDGTYVGPQGEVYPTKPELAQLKAMYGK
jgi:hypothetical protein